MSDITEAEAGQSSVARCASSVQSLLCAYGYIHGLAHNAGDLTHYV